MSKGLLIKGGHVIDPANNIDGVMDLLIEQGKIKEVAPEIDSDGCEVIEAGGKHVCPGFIDMHVHLREPGREDKETITSGTRAAARGGFTTVVCMPNTEPPVDNEGVVEFIYKRAKEQAVTNVYSSACITKGRLGKELVEMGKLKQSGVVALTDDGSPVADISLMRRALEYSAMFDLRIISHSEELSLTQDGLMNESYMSTVLGLTGIPRQAEEIAIYREISLSELTGVPIHIAHVSTAGSVTLIKEAKARGVKVTCETAPHYFSLTDESLRNYDTNLKVNPPIRIASDVAAIKAGLLDGTIDVIASDHAPHTDFEKAMEFAYAACGMVGLETAVSLSLDRLTLPLPDLVTKFTINPSRILNLPKGTLTAGADADVTIIDTKKEVVVDSKSFLSKSKNSPFDKWRLRGAPVMTIVGGKIVSS